MDEWIRVCAGCDKEMTPEEWDLFCNECEEAMDLD